MKRHRRTQSITVALVVVLGLALAVSGPAMAGDGSTQEVKKVKKIRIKKMADCEGEECAEHHRMIIERHGDMDPIHIECEGEECAEEVRIFVGEDGEMRKARAMAGHPVTWIEKDCEGEDCNVEVKVFVAKDGEFEELHGAAAHRMVMHGEECEGEECEQERRIVIRGGEGMHQIHGPGDFTWVGEGGGKRGFLGIRLTDLTEDLRVHFGAPADQGVMVGKVVALSAAETAGLEVGDIVTSVNGEPVASARALARSIASREGGESVDLGILRQGRAMTLRAVLGETETKMPHGMHTMVAFCGEGEDCELELGGDGASYDCGGAQECEVLVECEGNECTCTANGEPIDCEELDLPHHSSDE